ncbi:hypothetical protein D3C85_1533180 [compost metagenome]
MAYPYLVAHVTESLQMKTLLLHRCMRACHIPRRKSRGNIVATRVAVNVEDFSAEVEALNELGLHRARVHFLEMDAAACDESFF